MLLSTCTCSPTTKKKMDEEPTYEAPRPLCNVPTHNMSKGCFPLRRGGRYNHGRLWSTDANLRAAGEMIPPQPLLREVALRYCQAISRC